MRKYGARHQLAQNALEPQFHAWVEQQVGFVDSAVDRIVPPVEAGSDDPLAVTVENFSEWSVDKTQFKGVLPTIRDAILDPAVRRVVKGAMEESGAVLINHYSFDAQKHAAYINKILQRFEIPYLQDDVECVGRQPLRKLGEGDRLIKPLRGTLEYGLGHANLAKVSDLDEESEVVAQVVNAYNAMQ